ncbi:hypothetical protein Xmau_02832 [Xenorhabdus mauleonii]|uniref:Uncharacterized protein n=2 Tax=Xenorhabdus mauleonii TaxID=351675 RepID=A0A1I3IFV5_9GAMM|nr:hypothetical protein Xmau_02832 [Xenorhabdus mauleonii]SFI46811.1 hypothetical protein SAMN05421680_101328 [Xenorhabdus mauleonii]
MKTIKFTNNSNIKITITLKEKSQVKADKQDISPSSFALFEFKNEEYQIEYCNIFMSIDKFLISQTVSPISALSHLDRMFNSHHEFKIFFDQFSYQVLLVPIDEED